MTAPERDWREAKIPQWVKDGIDADLAQYRLTVALSWPTEAKPEPLPFEWGGYDHLQGVPVPGRYWAASQHEFSRGFDLQSIKNLDVDFGVHKWKGWAFRRIGESDWQTSPYRGPLFATERDANLYALWLACEEYAKKLAQLRSRI